MTLLITVTATPPGLDNITAASGRTVTKIKENGRGALAFTYDSATDTTGYINVVQDQVAHTVSLDFTFVSPDAADPNLAIYVQGAGQIPTTAFSFDSKSARLVLTTPDDFMVNRCAVDTITGEYTCAPGSSVTFDLAWLRDRFMTIREKIQKTETYGPVTTSYDGEYLMLAATVHGMWAGITSTNMAGYLLDTDSKTFIREVKLAANP
jgi:hypothetical protein